MNKKRVQKIKERTTNKEFGIKKTVADYEREIEKLKTELYGERRKVLELERVTDRVREVLDRNNIPRDKILHLGVEALSARMREEGFRRMEAQFESRTRKMLYDLGVRVWAEATSRHLRGGTLVGGVDTRFVNYCIAEMFGEISPRALWLSKLFVSLTAEDLTLLSETGDIELMNKLGLKLAAFDKFPDFPDPKIPPPKPEEGRDPLHEEWARLVSTPAGSSAAMSALLATGFSSTELSQMNPAQRRKAFATHLRIDEVWDAIFVNWIKTQGEGSASAMIALHWLFITTHPLAEVRAFATDQRAKEKPLARTDVSAHEIAMEIRTPLGETKVASRSGLLVEAGAYEKARQAQIFHPEGSGKAADKQAGIQM